MKKFKLIIFTMLFIIATLSFAACSKENKHNDKIFYEIEGVKNIHIGKEATTYDFSDGILGTKNLIEMKVDIDSSKVDFGTAGSYEVTYSIEEFKKNATVFIYDKPIFETTVNNLSYENASNNNGLLTGLTAKDTFGNKIDISVTQGILPNEFGFIEYGKHIVKYLAKDRVNNVTEFEREITVLDSDKPIFENFKIDLADIEVNMQLSGQLNKIIYNNIQLDFSKYIYNNGHLMFTKEFIEELGLGVFNAIFVTTSGYNTAKIEIVDELPARFKFSIDDCNFSNKIELVEPQIISLQKNITFEYEVSYQENKICSIIDEENKKYFIPFDEGIYNLKISAKRKNQDAGSKEYKFVIYDKVINWVINSKDTYQDIESKIEFENLIKNSKDFINEGDLSSTYISSNIANSGIIQLKFINKQMPTVIEGIQFYIYNPTGIALETYLFTNSGYYNSGEFNCGGVISVPVTIPAEVGWHLIELKYKRFDNHPSYGNRLIFNGNLATDEVELRIGNPDGWKWDSQNGNFGVYMSNIFEYNMSRDFGIVFNENNLNAEGLVNCNFNLPSSKANDSRIEFRYSVVDSLGKSFDISAGHTFKPTASGIYVFKTEAYFRNVLEKTESVNIIISDKMLTIALPKCYSIDIGESVTLPQASSIVKNYTFKYSVKNATNEVTVLDDNLTFTPSAFGDYTLIIQLFDGATVKDSLQKTIKIHSKNTALHFCENINQVNLVVASNTIEYTQEKCAPGENASLKFTSGTFNEKGNLNLDVNTNIKDTNVIKFQIYYTGKKPLTVAIYSTNSGMYSDFWYNGTRYNGGWDKVIVGKEGWQTIEIITGGKNLNADDTRIMFQTDGYLWDASDGDVALIYISNIYKS